LDTDILLGYLALGIAALALVVVSAAEAGIITISWSRARAHQNGAHKLLRTYIHQRYTLLRALSVAATTSVVTGTAAILFIVLHERTWTATSVAVVALGSMLGLSLLRQSARSLAMLSPERTGILLAPLTRLLQLVFAPIAWLVSLPVTLALRALGKSLVPPESNPVEELLAVLEGPANAEDDALSEQRRMMRGILDMSDQTVREVMSPRMDIRAVSTEASVGDVLKIATEYGVSRIPLYEESIDHIIGVVYAKDLLAYFLHGNIQPSLIDIARPPYFVPETKRTAELLADLRRDQVHLAIAVDEYGGTAGVVTVEDLLEEIVGEITDEHDIGEVDIERISDDEVVVDARLALDELYDLFGVAIEDEDFDTVGGLVFSLLGRLAVPGDEVIAREHGLRLRVISILGRRIKKVSVARLSGVAEPAPAE
jgi:putative hemolysin